MNGKIKKCLRERSKLTKFYYKNSQKKKRGPRKTTSKRCILDRGDIES